MEDQHDPRQVRLEKLQRLRDLGVQPYPYRFDFTHRAGEVVAQAEVLQADGTEIALAGRLVALRRMGKASFAHLKDNQVRLQIYLRRDDLPDEDFATAELLDLGDFVGVHGTLFHTRTGELTVKVQRLQLLSKAVRPLPVPKVEVVDGKQVVHDEVRDVEFRYRQRYVDLALNDEVAKVFLQRSQIIQTVREHLMEQGFLEVETPVLQVIYGGASAMPFTTHHKALDIPLDLRIATELFLKRLVAGGLDRVFEIGKDFRNEGGGSQPQSRVHHGGVLPSLRGLSRHDGALRGHL